LGVAIYKDGDVEGALAAFNAAQENFPDRAEVLNYKGEIYLDQGRHEKGSIQLFLISSHALFRQKY
jgi:Flp pilus assembly protein TadD